MKDLYPFQPQETGDQEDTQLRLNTAALCHQCHQQALETIQTALYSFLPDEPLFPLHPYFLSAHSLLTLQVCSHLFLRPAYTTPALFRLVLKMIFSPQRYKSMSPYKYFPLIIFVQEAEKIQTSVSLPIYYVFMIRYKLLKRYGNNTSL